MKLGPGGSFALCATMSGALFALDLLLPLGVGVGLLYVAVVAVTFASRVRPLPLYAAGAASGLVVAGGLLSPSGAEGWIGGVNRALILVAVWTTALVGHRLRASAEAQVRRSRERARDLRRADRLKNEIVGNLSHELRTPLNAVLGYTTLLREGIYGSPTPEQNDVLGRIVHATQRLLRLIDDLLVASRVRAGEVRLAAAEVDLRELCLEVAGVVEPLVREKGLQSSNEVDPDFPPLWTDREKLRRVLLALVSNAVKFTDEGTVSIRATLIDGLDRARIEVQDTGIGIAKEDQAAIFDHFRQLDPSATREYGGVGLGLFIVRRLVVLLGGTVQVESDHGGGSNFIVEIPLRIGFDEEVEHETPAGISATA